MFRIFTGPLMILKKISPDVSVSFPVERIDLTFTISEINVEIAQGQWTQRATPDPKTSRAIITTLFDLSRPDEQTTTKIGKIGIVDKSFTMLDFDFDEFIIRITNQGHSAKIGAFWLNSLKPFWDVFEQLDVNFKIQHGGY